MRRGFGVALGIVLAAFVAPAGASEEPVLRQQELLPPPPPLVPEGRRPGQPLFPLPRPIPTPTPRIIPPAPQRGQAPASAVECGIRQVWVNPNIDPKFVIPVAPSWVPGGAPIRVPADPGLRAPSDPTVVIPAPDSRPTFTIRRVTPPIPCP
jgi:hypothetical protein